MKSKDLPIEAKIVVAKAYKKLKKDPNKKTLKKISGDLGHEPASRVVAYKRD